MNDNVISLKQFIDEKDQYDNTKVHTFCRLMKRVSEAIDKEERNIVRIKKLLLNL